MAANGIALVNTEDGSFWFFQYFPQSIQVDDQANWQAQNVTIGTKPLSYSNRDPQRIEIEEVWLDGSDNNESLTQSIEDLRSLMTETDSGVPPTLRLICGDWQQSVVLQSLKADLQLFDERGRPLRARISMSLLECKLTGRATSRTTDPETGTIDNF